MCSSARILRKKGVNGVNDVKEQKALGERGAHKMREENMTFGQFIKRKRIQDPRELTLKDMSAVMGMSLSMLSDVEQGRRRAWDADKIETFCSYLELSSEDKALMYDLAAKNKNEIPSDIDDTFLHSEVGNMARMALRMTNEGVASEEDWKTFIRKLEENRGKMRD